jgi:hypothetical protein
MTVAQAARVTGADPESVEAAAWAEAKRLVMERDSCTCLATGELAVDVHHRVPRGIGGTADPKVAFGLANLVAVTRSAHNAIHRGEGPAGFLLESWQDPETVPLLVSGEHGGSLVYLTAYQAGRAA